MRDIVSKKKYNYMVIFEYHDYKKGNGKGRCFLSTPKEIDCQQDIEDLDKTIKERESALISSSISRVCVVDFKLLKVEEVHSPTS